MTVILFKCTTRSERKPVLCKCTLTDIRRENWAVKKDGHRKQWSVEVTLTGTWNNRNVAQQAEDLRTEQWAVPNVQKFIEENLWTGKALLLEKIMMWNKSLAQRWYTARIRYACGARLMSIRNNDDVSELWTSLSGAHLQKVLCRQQLVQKLESFFWSLTGSSIATE